MTHIIYSSQDVFIHPLFICICFTTIITLHKQQHREKDGTLKRELDARWRSWTCFFLAADHLQDLYKGLLQKKQKYFFFLFLSRWKPFAPIEVTSTVICNLLICWGRQSILKRWGMLRCAEDGKQGWSWKGVLMLQVLSHLPSSVWSMHAGFCRYEEWIGLKPTHMMNRFRFTISGCNLVWWLQRKKKKKDCVERNRKQILCRLSALLHFSFTGSNTQGLDRWFRAIGLPWLGCSSSLS